MNIFKKIGLVFSSIWTIFFNATKAAWEKLDQPLKDAFFGGTGLTELVKAYAEKGIDEFYKLAESKFKLSKQTVDNLLKWAGSFYNLPAEDTEGLLLLIKQKAEKLSKEDFGKFMNGLMQGFTQSLAPAGTPLKLITFFAEWFYQRYFKKAID